MLLWLMTGLISGYELAFAGLFLPQIWRLGFGVGYESTFHPVPITVVKLWPWVLMCSALLCISDILLKLRYTIVLTAASLLLTWTWFFLVSLDYFDGPSSVHKTAPTFEFDLFMTGFGGFYPISILIIIAYGCQKFILKLKSAQQGDAPEPATIADPASPTSQPPAR